MARDPNPDPNSLMRRMGRDARILQVERMRVGKFARACGCRANLLDRLLIKLVNDGAPTDDIVAISGCVSQALNDWCRITQIPLPPRPKADQRPMIDINMLQSLPDDTSLVESLRSKPAQAAAPAQPGPTPEPAPAPVVDVEQAINPG